MIANIFTEFGTEFWASPMGLFVSVSIFICSVVNIISPNIDDNMFDRVWYSVTGVTMFAAIVGAFSHDPVHSLTKSILLLMAIRFIASLFFRLHSYYKYGRCEKTMNR